MANACMKITYISILCLTIIFAIVELALASDLVRDINRSFFGFSSFIRPRTRYLVFCSSWTLLSGIFLVMIMALAESAMAIIVQLIVLFMSMVFWLIGAALFTSAIGGKGINCGPGLSNCHFVNIVNSTMAFAWINWAFVFIAFCMALWLAIFGRDHERKEATRNMDTTNAAPVSNAPVTNPPATNPPA
ncbi:hypothetical protein BJ322DRAFT_839367 [Thelephora terrestris]|uniref:MARVEL domain-containing protein n=1 Tax=Thelephora terrestris TaxID=56493 RepID=A0A9P6HF08_9AGAM|nr:hypothetical protein BJ322DRAFT_839367 [Thelephora terrestris]